MTDLKPCPFCGGMTSIVKGRDSVTSSPIFRAFCTQCQNRTMTHETSAKAVDAWNRRHIPDGWKLVPTKITAESGHKAGMMGDFTVETMDCCYLCDGVGHDANDDDCEMCLGAGEVGRDITISWTTIKAIHRRIVEIAEGGE